MIKTYIFNGNEVAALYKGSNLIYKKEPEKPKNILAGKFTQPGEYTFKYNNKSNVEIPLNEDNTFEIEVTGLTDCSNMFLSQSKLYSITSFPDLSNVSTFFNMFFGCTSLIHIDLSRADLSNLKSFSNAFRQTKVTCIDLSHTTINKLSGMGTMCYDCSQLTTFLFGNLDLANLVANVNSFDRCYNLTTIRGNITGIKRNVYLSDAPLTNDSAMVFINGLSEVSDTKTITFKSTTYSTLTEEQIALATSKGWSVVSA